MRRLRDLIGQRVMSSESAESLGKVKGVVVDAGSAKLAALRVKGTDAEFVDWTDLSGAGPDAVVVTGTSSFRAAGAEYEERAQSGDVDLLGKRVLTDGGFELGSVTDAEFDEADGSIEAVLIGDERIAGDRLRAVGGYAVVVRS
ncbi:hypothetical protein BH24ACT3_BH24ACT3_16800 [soil metagenome]